MVATLGTTAREAVSSACAGVDDAGPQDAVDGVPTGLVARPTDTDQVAAVLRACAAHGLAVVPRGNGTKLSWGSAPRRADVLLDLSGLDQVLDHAAGDLIVAAQAGAPLAEVQRVAAQGGQRLALDETVPGTTVGGMLATNTSGPRRTAIGTARDLLIGVTMVRADGVVAKAGGRVVKNVAGYDLGKLLIGSMGTLGVVVDATFRLHPVPAASRWVSVPVADPAQALAVSQSVVHAQVVPAAVEVEWADGAGTVSVLLEGREDGVAGRAASTRELLGTASSESDEPPAGGAAYPWTTGVAGDERETALKLSFELSGLADVLAAVAGTPARLRGSAGSGVVYAALPAATPAAEVAALLARLREVCTRRGGAAVVVDAPAAVKAAVDVWGPVPALDLMRRVKDQFDPDHRLAPGRFVGGL
ncbi:glycolate oxidase FAD binding subunit [Nocardioides scoriae]|uniref:Glycolate oxidase FAD binding subunit n=1 Tax=Nocardioides scoriae TaxID=642780 RepID=A0A1H1XQ23_9ACTN|nr:FAD-binding oxidoreductase [Nocardioides scoriae]SDT11348.1 glycolate oxidase FAD binding subunit [Nocardioides scoriae]